MAKSPSLASQETVETTTEYVKDKKPEEQIEMEVREFVSAKNPRDNYYHI